MGDIVRDVMGDHGDAGGAARNSGRVVRRSASRSGTAKSPATTPGQGAHSVLASSAVNISQLPPSQFPLRVWVFRALIRV